MTGSEDTAASGGGGQETVFVKVRPEDHAILVCIRNGDNDVYRINRETALTRSQINYAFKKLSELGLICVFRPDGYTQEYLEGQKRVFQKPKEASLTERGVEYFEWSARNADLGTLRNLDREELVQQVRENQQAVAELRRAFQIFSEQVLRESEKE